MTVRHVAIVGAGYSGTVQAVELLRRGVAVTLIERGPQPGRGVAYGTRTPRHLLNVRASGMSALADEPDHFAAWLALAGGAGGDDFAPRRTYGRYLKELLGSARDATGERLRIIRGEAVDVAGLYEVRLASGETIAADAVVLALGNLPSAPPLHEEDELPSDILVGDPWAEDWADGLGRDDTVLLIGTGLTAVDAILSLDGAGFDGRILALSRRGLLPRAHSGATPQPQPQPRPLPARCIDLLRAVRADAERIGWRSAVDRLRPVTQQLWTGAPATERRRFLRHLRPWWDVHRHRIAPSVADRIGHMRQNGVLEVGAGRLLSLTAGSDGLAQIRWRPRSTGQVKELSVRRIVNCTGPQFDVTRAGEPLLDALLASGRIRPDPFRIGIDVDGECRAIDSGGQSATNLYVIGPMTRGAFWEVVAVPDIRVQVGRVASLAAGLPIGDFAPPDPI